MSGIRILHVDDDPQFGELASIFLEREDDRFSVDTATSVSEGLAHLADHDVDCVVSDYEMPERNGIEFLQTVRESSDVPFILFTGKGSEEVASEAISAGVTDYLQKESHTSQYTVLANRIANAVEQSRARRAVEQAERTLSQLADKSKDVLFLFDGDWQELLFVNEAYEELWGRSTETLADDPQSFLEAIHPEDRERVQRSMTQISNGAAKELEYRVVHPDGDDDDRSSGGDDDDRSDENDGDQRWVRAESRPVFDDDGTVTRIVGFVRDITAHREQAEALEEARERFQTLIEHGSDMITVIDESGEVQYQSPASERVLGYEPAARIGENSFDSIHPDDRARVWEAFARTIERPETTTERVEYRFEHADGSWVWLETIGTNQTNTAVDGYVLTSRDITDRRARERELERTNALLSTLFEALPVGVLAEDESRDVLAANEQLFDLFELPGTPSAAVGEDCEAMAEEISDVFVDPQAFVDRTAELVDSRERTANEELALRDGRTFSRSYRPLELPDGDGHLWVYRDTTDREEREQELHEMKAQQEAAINAGSVGTWEWDISSNELVTNPEFARTFGIDPDAARDGVPLERFVSSIHEDDRDRVRQGIDAALECGGEYEETYRVWNADDDRRWVSARGHVECDEDGTPIRFHGALTDITDRKVREQRLEALSETTRELMAADTREAVTEIGVNAAREVLNLDANAIHLYDPDRSALVPVAKTEAVTELVGDLPTFTGDGSIAWRVYTEGDPLAQGDIYDDPDIYDPETPIRSELHLPLGEHGILIAGSPEPEAFDQQDLVLGEILAGSVASALEQAEQTDRLRARERELTRQNNRLDEFASVVSHDLRNPLNIATGRLELAREECESPHLDDVQWAHDRMNDLVDDLLTLAREGKRVGETEPVELASLGRHCWQHVATADATLVVETDRSIEADRSRLEQLLENLVRNAVEHGGADVTVTIGDVEDGFYLEDDGPGIPPEDRETVFDSGYSTSTAGTGFGLSIVAQVVDAHGWELSVTDGTDGGARFEITGLEFTDE
ncbi:PAS domain-containing protein [Halobacteria archaeon AArc-m2/3/4]|uniref:histidine kinase n=1 Tax=Natronoglomus mannanivorans TaxID=2979990 RepID=A0AAP2Z367_9EURY|nr:PAS domain-containing protein [Halobacteria archaeon AArc-xg1-1]MCU4972826.1 PAS domain-containing protein [Halobacteria archaeon AArc-m2/3/4]